MLQLQLIHSGPMWLGATVSTESYDGEFVVTSGLTGISPSQHSSRHRGNAAADHDRHYC